VAEGLFDTRGRAFPSTNGLIGAVVVDAPTTLGSGADRWLLATGLTWPTTAAGGGGTTFGVADATLAGVVVRVTGVDDILAVADGVLRTEVVCGVTGRAVVICDRSATEAVAIEVVLAVVPAIVDLTGTGAATTTGGGAGVTVGDGKLLLAAIDGVVVVVVVVVVMSGVEPAVVLLVRLTVVAGTGTLQFSVACIVGMSFGSADVKGAGLDGDEAVAGLSDKMDMEP